MSSRKDIYALATIHVPLLLSVGARGYFNAPLHGAFITQPTPEGVAFEALDGGLRGRSCLVGGGFQ